MKSFFKALVGLLSLLLWIPSSFGQTWSFTNAYPATPSTITYATTGNVTVATLTNYVNWSTLVYTYSTAVSAGNGTMQIGFVGNFNSKYVYVSLTDNTGKTTSLDIAAPVLSVPYSSTVTSATTTENFSIDWNLVTKPSGFDLTHISKVTLLLYTDAGATNSPNITNSTLAINLPVFGTGTTGVSTVTNPTIGQEWALESSGYLYSNNNHGVIVGSPTTNNVSDLLSYPYYSFLVNGRTNFVGNDNAIGIWSALKPASGFRHYLGFTNATFPSTTTEYSMINAYEWNGSTGNPKHLTLQNYNDPNGTGNVGIGYHPMAPEAKLSVVGKTIMVSPNTPASGYRQTVSIGSNTFSNAIEFAEIDSYEWNYSTNSSNAKHLVFQNYGNNLNGNVGIGYHTSAPIEKLSVNGNIRCKQLIGTQQGWSDFVFAPDYKLKSLNEVKRYIEKEKHLPNIPSEKEIVENGLNVNNMLQLHMEKIEELTLYLIKQEEVMKAQQEQIDLLKKEVEYLKETK